MGFLKMSFKLKLIFVAVFVLMVTVAVAGFLGYRESKWKVKDLARELLQAKTERAFALCEQAYQSHRLPPESVKRKIAAIRIGEDGYIAVLKNEPGPEKGVLVVHPSDVGVSIYNDDFPHIQKIIDSINAHGGQHGYSDFILYRQGTEARGLRGERKIGYYMYFAPWKWVILGTGYEKDIFASRDALRKTLFQVFVLVGIVAILVVTFIIRFMFKPIQRFTESTQEVAKGNWDVSIEYGYKDEIGTLADSFNQMVQSLRENARMWHEFNVARDMQAQMLPKDFPRIGGLEITAKSIPTKEVGGDFYDFIAFENGRLGMVVGDVSGHGVPAAMVMTAAMSAMRFAADEKSRADEVLNLVNARLNKDIQNHMFVALFYGIYEPATRELHYCNAGQTMPYLFRKGQVRFLPQAQNSDRFPLGIVHGVRYEQLTMGLEPGDILISYTDGIVDAMNGHDETFGFERLAQAICRYAELTPEMMVDRMVQEMLDYSNGQNFHDDVTLVILKVV